MKKKLFEKKVHILGEYASKIKMQRCDLLAMKLQVIEGVPKKPELSNFFLKSVEFYTTKEVDDFTSKAPVRYPNLFQYTSNKDDYSETLFKACEEWQKMTLRDRWFLMKVIGYFGNENEKKALDKVIKKSPPVSFDLLSNTVRGTVEKSESDLGKNLLNWLNQAELEGF